MYTIIENYLKFKKLLIASMFMSIAITSANAQLSIGALTGVNLNQFTMPGSTLGINAGAFGSYKLTPFLSTRLELLYSQQGGGRQNYSLPLDESFSGTVAQLNYINPYVYLHTVQVPVLVDLTLPEFEDAAVRPQLLLGGSYSYMFAADELHTAQYIFTDGTFANIPYLRENVGANYVASQLSLMAGMGMVFKSEKRSFAFDIRYRQGITQLNNVRQTLSYQDGRLFSSTLSFNFSVTIFNF